MSDIATRVKALQELRASEWEKGKAIVDKYKADEAFSVEDRTAWDQINADLNVQDEDIRSLIETDKRNKAADEARSGYRGLLSPSGSTEPDFEAEVRSMLQGKSTPKGGLVLGALGKRADGSGNRTSEERHLMAGNYGAEARTLSRLSAAAGQNTVKTSFYNTLVQNLIVNSGILQAGPTVLTTASGEVIQIPKTLTHSSGALFAEAATITNSDPTFGQIPLSAYKYAVLLQVSRELVDDTSVDLLGYIGMEMGRAISNAVGVDLILGNGTNKPRGVTIDSTLGVTGGTAVVGAFTADNLFDLMYSVTPVYRASESASWLMQDITLGAVRKLKDTQGRYLWEPSLQLGAPDVILGKRVVTDPNVAAVALSAKSVLFGDFSRYFVREVDGIRLESSNDYAFANDLVTYKAAWRADGALVDLTGAVKHFIGNAA